jgi:ethanolamine permease
LSGGGGVGKALLNMAVFGAVISYALVMFSFIVLRLGRPGLQRPYRSPLGIPGAALGAVLAVVALVACFADREVRPGVVGTGLFVLAGLGYYVGYSRHRLVAQAPEEEIALAGESPRANSP